MRLPTDLRGILRERLGEFSYRDMKVKRRSGMTRMQEWLRSHGIREEQEPREGYVSVEHPAAWTGRDLLLVPKELAIKITTVGRLP